MHIESFGASGIGQLKAHIMREREAGHYGNENIDVSKSVQNFSALEVGDWDKTIAEKVATHEAVSGKKLRKDANILCSVVVTLPEAYKATKKGPLSHFFSRKAERVQAEREKAFFEASARFLNGVFGGVGNVVAAEVHKDEVSPHLHFTFVPVVKEGTERKGKARKAGTISKDAVVTREVLLRLHPDLDAHLRKELPWYKGGILLDGAEKEGAKYVELVDFKGASPDIVKGARKLAGLAKREKTLEKREKALEARESVLKEKTAEWNRVVNQANMAVSLSKDVNELKRENFALKEELKARPTREEVSKLRDGLSKAEERARRAESKVLSMEARLANRGSKTLTR